MFYFSKKVRLFSQNDVLFLFYFLINPAGTTVLLQTFHRNFAKIICFPSLFRGDSKKRRHGRRVTARRCLPQVGGEWDRDRGLHHHQRHAKRQYICEARYVNIVMFMILH